MPQSLSFLLVHLIFSTKDRDPCLGPAVRPDLHAYLATVARGMDCECYRVGGVADHVHLAVRLARTVTLAKLVEELKTSSSRWLKTRSPALSGFAWQRGYGAFSVGPADLDSLRRYIDGQVAHHRTRTFQEEYRMFLNKYGVETHLDYREHDGIRSRTIKAIKSVVKQFSIHADNPWVHEMGTGMVDKFLTSLRGKDGKNKATRKTWNNYRNDLHGFLEWCSVADAATNRPYLFENPVTAVRKFSARQVREDQEAKPATTSIDDAQRIFGTLMRWRDGVLLRHFAFLYFVGIRPEELRRLAPREAELVNLKTRTITIPAKVAKTGHERQILISDNLAPWLKVAPAGILPTNSDRLIKQVRKHFALSHDEPRHSFISYHVALHRSVGDAALQAGNSESIVKCHYLNTHTREEGAAYFGIVPEVEVRRAVIRAAQNGSDFLKAV